MRVKRARKVRKYLRYYRTCHGFRAPYKVRSRTPTPRASVSTALLASVRRRRRTAAPCASAPTPPMLSAPRRLAHLDSYSTSSPLETRDIPAPARPRGPRLTPRPPPHGPVIRQVLCDGNFLHAVSRMKLGDPKDVLAKYLGSPPKLFTTRCVQHELRGMGHEFKEASLAARRLAEVEGGPDPPAKAFDSVLAAVEGDNAERFLVCTQDEKLRVALREASPYVPVIFCHTSGLQMEPPADAEGSGWRVSGKPARGSATESAARWDRRRRLGT